MGVCTSKPSNFPSPNRSPPQPDGQNPNTTDRKDEDSGNPARNGEEKDARDGKKDVRIENGKNSPFFALYTPSPANYLFSKKSPMNSMTPKRFFRPPLSPAKHIRAALARRRGRNGGSAVLGEGGGEEGVGEGEAGLDKSFGFSKNFVGKYEIGKEVGRGHFGFTCCATSKKGDMKRKRPI